MEEFQRKGKHCFTIGEESKWDSHCEYQCDNSQKTQRKSTVGHSSTTLCPMHKEVDFTYTSSAMLITALFTIANKWTQPKYPRSEK